MPAAEEGPGQPANVPVDLPCMATVVLDADGVIVGWSPAAERLLGYRADEVLGRKVRMLLMPQPHTEQSDPREKPQPDRVTARHRDGHRVDLGVRVSPLSAPDGMCWLVSGIDLATAPWWAVSQSVLERFLTHSPFGVAVLGTDLRYVWLNKTLERMAGVSMDERLGRRMSEVLPRLGSPAVEAQMEHALKTGEAVLDFEYQGYTPADPERQHAYSTSFFRLDDDNGRVMGVCYMGVDVTERWRAKERLALLTESGGRIGSTLDIGRTAQELAMVAVPKLADFAAVDLLDSVLAGDDPSWPATESSPPLRRVGLESVEPGCPEAAVRIGEAARHGPTSPIVRSLIDGHAVLEPDMSPDTQLWLAEDVVRAETVRKFNLGSLMVVPVQARGISLGVALFLRRRQNGPFRQDDLHLAEEFVSRAAVCLDNARRYTRERTASLTLQHSLLPQVLPTATAMEVTSRYLPANSQYGVGGDWFDVIELSGARVALVVGDVVGHGINAAATMGRLRAAVHTLAAMDLPPDELLARVDDLVIRLISEETSGNGVTATSVLGATCLYAVYDPVSGRCVAARAGHLPPAVVTADGSVSFADLPAGPPLGLGTLPFESAEFELGEGGLFALFTDGLVQSSGRDLESGLDRLAAALCHPESPLEEVCDTILNTMHDGPQLDDLALIVARTHTLGPEQVVSWDLDADPAVVGETRTLVADALATWGLDDLAYTAQLIVSELVTNVIRHAVGPIRLRLIRHSELVCEITDGSSTAPRMRHARVMDEGGRGLFLVAQMAHRWGTRYVPDGKITWAELALPGGGV
jgi:PAS domain S-box-containing protein